MSLSLVNKPVWLFFIPSFLNSIRCFGCPFPGVEAKPSHKIHRPVSQAPQNSTNEELIMSEQTDSRPSIFSSACMPLATNYWSDWDPATRFLISYRAHLITPHRDCHHCERRKNRGLLGSSSQLWVNPLFSATFFETGVQKVSSFDEERERLLLPWSTQLYCSANSSLVAGCCHVPKLRITQEISTLCSLSRLPISISHRPVYHSIRIISLSHPDVSSQTSGDKK